MLGQFEIDLTELWYNWYSDSIVGTCEDMPKDEMKAWFLKEVELMLKQIIEENTP
jgi:hypothetical protein